VESNPASAAQCRPLFLTKSKGNVLYTYLFLVLSVDHFWSSLSGLQSLAHFWLALERHSHATQPGISLLWLRPESHSNWLAFKPCPPLKTSAEDPQPRRPWIHGSSCETPERSLAHKSRATKCFPECDLNAAVAPSGAYSSDNGVVQPLLKTETQDETMTSFPSSSSLCS